MPCPVAFACALVTAAALTSPARAHTRTATFSDVALNGSTVRWSLRLHAGDLVEPLGLQPATSPAGVLAARASILDYVKHHLVVEASARACQLTQAEAVLVSASDQAPAQTKPPDTQANLRVTLTYGCPENERPLVIGYRLFFDLDPLHTGFLRLSVDGQPIASHLFRKGDETLTVRDAPEPWSGQALQVLALGIEHIFLGYDHLAFLAALLLGVTLATRGRHGQVAQAASRRSALIETTKLVTAFTLAHSLTLAYAALYPGAIPTAWVEPAIAASVAYVGSENLRPRVIKRRWLLTFLFGLVHGFGFASVLHELGLPRTGLVSVLFAFNLGVELGQLAVVSLCLPILLALARRNPDVFERWGVRGASFVLATFGAIWFVLRVG